MKIYFGCFVTVLYFIRIISVRIDRWHMHFTGKGQLAYKNMYHTFWIYTHCPFPRNKIKSSKKAKMIVLSLTACSLSRQSSLVHVTRLFHQEIFYKVFHICNFINHALYTYWILCQKFIKGPANYVVIYKQLQRHLPLVIEGANYFLNFYHGLDFKTFILW
jgi:hypothetical protein